MKNKKILFSGAISVLLAIIAVIIVSMPTINEIQIEPEAEILEVSSPVITTSPPITASPTTTPAPAEITPILMEEPIIEDMSVSEEIIIIEIIETPLTIQPAPPPAEMPEGAQWEENGQYYKIEDEQKYIWDNVLGWGRDNGTGTVTIMDAQTSGYRFFIEPCGTVNLSKLIAPDGSIIFYEEYQIFREFQ
jgi:hypothetical protein